MFVSGGGTVGALAVVVLLVGSLCLELSSMRIVCVPGFTKSFLWSYNHRHCRLTKLERDLNDKLHLCLTVIHSGHERHLRKAPYPDVKVFLVKPAAFIPHSGRRGSPSRNTTRNNPDRFAARASTPFRLLDAESGVEKKSEQMDVRETSAGYVPAFSFKHGSPAVNCTREKRASHRKLANLEKFLGSVKKSAMMRQYDGLPFHSLSTSKRYKVCYGFIKGSESKRDESITFFESEFEVLERIGFGNFAEVFKVRWRRDNRIYALKRSIARFGSCFDNVRATHEEQLRWMDEAFYHTSVSGHPNIVECVQSWEEAGYFHIQMEYMPERLDTFALKNYPIPENILWNCFTDLLMALDHVHKKGYCHFDLKPENIFLDEFRVTKLGDFSLISDPEADHNEAGDARYLPLEAMESKTLGFACDIFSLGITMLDMCTDIQLTGHGAEWRALREGPLPVEFEDRITVVTPAACSCRFHLVGNLPRHSWIKASFLPVSSCQTDGDAAARTLICPSTPCVITFRGFLEVIEGECESYIGSAGR
ncbi:putative Membrane-associated tyrosine- and threonine-specific cdc2-inhibitory kinase wee-1.3 [Hypsibius exemplaris]|uniref:non-specific serine/threonine protein kinase n=1 Tax=Hypsibius exemplaris TaxID=2072580 RepID=A0A1W0WB08_HYPEX|nr:putative Membrane-associated tyrosine- and threonine-specific cdc2-inhibitory kinase wee-1.3 [Hypsibius exemplaris]